MINLTLNSREITMINDELYRDRLSGVTRRRAGEDKVELVCFQRFQLDTENDK